MRAIAINGDANEASDQDLRGGVSLNPDQSSKTLDGFIRRSGVALGRPGKQAASAVHHKLRRSQALMRSAVSKPTRGASAIAARTVDKPKLRPLAAKASKANLMSTPAERLTRAKSTIKHARVLRFGQPAAAKAKPIVKKVSARPAAPVMATPRLAGQGQLNARPLPSLVTSASHHRLERMLDWALVNADAHKQALKASKARRRPLARLGWPKWLSISLITLVVILAAGFAAYEKNMAVGMAVANLRSGVHGSVPAYTPAGFSIVKPPAFAKDEISLTFKSSDSERRFAIVERPSSWDSQSLLENYVKTTGEQYQMTQVGGKTVFTYGSTNATWVDNKVWFVIQNGAQLNADEVGKIANSL